MVVTDGIRDSNPLGVHTPAMSMVRQSEYRALIGQALQVARHPDKPKGRVSLTEI